jgi:MraZ protein
VFVGRFEHSLDGKGRLVLPSAFRADLRSGGVLAPWDRCLALWTRDQFGDVAQAMKLRVSESDQDMDIFRLFLAEARFIEPDGQGRFVVPEEHRIHAGLVRDTVVSGQLDRVEIWDRSRFQGVRDGQAGQLAEAIRDLRL